MNKTFVLIVIILLLEIPIASSYTPSEIEWAHATEATLYKGNSVTNGPYTVLAKQFPAAVPGFKKIITNEIIPETPVSPVVYLEIYKNGALMKETVLSLQSPNEIDPDYEVKVSLTDILPGTSRDWVLEYYNPWAKVSISLRGKPKLEVTVTTDKTNYVSSTDEILTETVKVTNTGDAVARNIEVDLDPGVFQLRGGSTSQFHHSYLELKKGETITPPFEMIFLVPKVAADTSYTLSAKTKGYDVKDLEYQANGSLSVSVAPKDILEGISVSKAVKDRIYLKDTILVRVTVSNGGDFDLYNVRVTDSLNENFELKFDSPMHWEIPVIESGHDESRTYSLKPLQTNLDGFKIPVATAKFLINNKEYSSSSESPSVIVNGPKIILNKTVDKQIVNISEDITITVSFNNAGNVATRTQVVDFLPDNVSLVSGQYYLSEYIFLEINKPQGFSYIIRPNTDGVIELPAAVANYTDNEYKGAVRTGLSSQRPVITVIDPEKINISINSNTTGTNSNGTNDNGQISVTLPDTTSSKNAPSEKNTGSAPENKPEITPEITPTPITPFIGTISTIILMIFAACYRRK